MRVFKGRQSLNLIYKILIASMLLAITANATSSNNWHKLLEQSDKSRLRAEQERIAKPIVAPISSHFGPRFHPITRTQRMHRGIDLAAPQGELFTSVAEGKVIEASSISGYGNTILIQHGNGITTRYAHASELLVSVGDKVQKNQYIGRVGKTGLATGPHLHFEIKMDGKHVDPLDFIKDDTPEMPLASVLPPKNETIASPATQETLFGRHIVTSRTMWSISREISVAIDYTSAEAIMQYIVDINPESFPTNNANYRLAHVPLQIPKSEVISADLPTYMKTDRPIWLIAEDLKKQTKTTASIYQIMHSIKHKNPKAFINNNINRRLASVPLLIPDNNDYLMVNNSYSIEAFKADIISHQS